MLRTGVSVQDQTDPLILDNGTLTTERYSSEILDVHVRPYAVGSSPSFILMADDAYPGSAFPTNTVNGK